MTLTHDTTITATAPGLAALAAEHAVTSEAGRTLAPPVVEALRASGFARHFVPRAHGGSAGTFVELSRAVAVLGAACPATAWCASIAASLSRMAAYLPATGQHEVWGQGPDPVVVGSLMPLGTVTAVPGGWRLSGEWPYVSGVDFADWALLCGMAPGDNGPVGMMFAVPRASFAVRDTWLNVGMQATGSNTVSTAEVFVPAHRAFPREDLFTGGAMASSAHCHQVPLQAVNGLSFATPALGAARGALASASAYIAGKLRAPARGPGLTRATYDTVLARSAGEIDAVELLFDRASATADRGSDVTPLEVARTLRDCALGVETLVGAVDRLFRAAGTTGQSVANPLQRYWRDVNSASTHVALQLEPAAIAYTDRLLEL
ncbi:hydrolase [Actinokineospora sp. NBRC 105648]|uniref:hydrolase n=1 Tax=Actinokineospora sp. NBRC 105648 TaxID=3032206 RepID=UPI0024A19F27|nr:hydrolase [Actinokineospora sp. NBRC 105648]GLZ38897.1 hydrolase [Actinokineospora sp. NBRC 105648]